MPTGSLGALVFFVGLMTSYWTFVWSMRKADTSRLVSPRVNKVIPDFSKTFSLLLPVCKIAVKELIIQSVTLPSFG